MAGSRENRSNGSQADLLVILSQILAIMSQILAIVTETRTRVCATPTAPAKKSWFGKDMWLEFGRMLLKGIMPLLTPYLIAVLSGLGAMVVAGWKAFTRGWFIF